MTATLTHRRPWTGLGNEETPPRLPGKIRHTARILCLFSIVALAATVRASMLDDHFQATVSTDEPGWGVTYVYSVVLQADDKIIVAGRFTQVDGVRRRNI